jgi:molybdopterin-containing oxidoreductase family iron-sulfur binding subunit
MSSMSSSPEERAPKYWKSLAERQGQPNWRESKEREFFTEDPTAPAQFSRRRFMQLMGASAALATGQACHWPRENILAHHKRPEDHIPGVPKQYASSMEMAGVSTGLHLTSYDGRPIKVDGNPNHPCSLGSSSAFHQASVLDLYDPDRSKLPQQRDAKGVYSPASWENFATFWREHSAAYQANQGKGLFVCSSIVGSPTLARQKAAFLARYPSATWVEYEPIHMENARLGLREVMGQSGRASLNLLEADVVVAFDDNFLVEHPDALRLAHDFAIRRQPKPSIDRKTPMNRLYALESRYTHTGVCADHRLPLQSSRIGAALVALGQTLARLSQRTLPGGFPALPDKSLSPEEQQFIEAVAKDLLKANGAGLLTVGAGQPPEVHAWAAHLNIWLGHRDRSVTYYVVEDASAHRGSSFAQLAYAMAHEAVKTLILLDVNPAYTSPGVLSFKESLAKVPVTIHMGYFVDETALLSQWHLPLSHYLESWGDGRSFAGTYTTRQPLIKPLHETRSPIECMSILLGESASRAYDAVFATFRQIYGAELDVHHRFALALQQGFLAKTEWPVWTGTPQPLTSNTLANAVKPDLEVTFWPDSHTYDGRFANNSWLQELPDFMTKLTWDNAAVMGPRTAEALHVEQDQCIELLVKDQKLRLPVCILPGQAKGSIAITLGYGRGAAGRVGGSYEQHVPIAGFDTYKLYHAEAMNYVSSDVRVAPLEETYALAITQDHHTLDPLGRKEMARRGEEIIREGELSTYLKNPQFAQEEEKRIPVHQLWEGFDYETGHRWGMAIDLNACTGCNACVMACQAENNISVVGKEQVLKGRIMHWLRIDRYFSGDEEQPRATPQPMACQHCENAPCEGVCPVAATLHSEEGLNMMVYNRCVGTRYCSNNCPYKVRRFNFLNYHKHLEQPSNHLLKMVHNPEVTVRSRGVMEKCSYCVQRIQNHKIRAKRENRPLRDGEIVTACAQACPSRAIKFGDLNDEGSEVAKWQADSRAYTVLPELNTRNRTQYLARIFNKSPFLDSETPAH